MAFFTTLAAIATVGLGVASFMDQKKTNKEAGRQQQKQLTTSKEAAALRSTKAKDGARVKVGSEDKSKDVLKKAQSSVTRKSSGSTVGGVSASAIGGL